MSINFTINTLILAKKVTIVKILNERDGKFSHPNQFKILGNKKQESEWTEEKTKREMQKLVTAQKMKFSIKDFFCKCDESAVSSGIGYIY